VIKRKMSHLDLTTLAYVVSPVINSPASLRQSACWRHDPC